MTTTKPIMKYSSSKNLRSGAVLLVVLFVSMVVAIISLGVLARGSRQMACGDAVAQRLKLDYLAEAGLVYAKTLLLNPQEVDTLPDPNGFWPGASALWMEAGDNYYDLAVTRSTSGPTYTCTYNIQSKAYRQEGAERTLQSNLYAQLRLDPCIAYWAGGNTTEPNTVTINGDVYCNGTMTSLRMVNGDVFAAGFTGSSTGQHYVLPPEGVIFPDLQTSLYTPQYNFVEDWDSPAVVSYFSYDLDVNDCNNPPVAFVPDSSNPAGVLCRAGDLYLIGNVNITGTLVVDGDVIVKGPGTTTISPLKNFPAVVVTGTLRLEAFGSLAINGLVQTNEMSVDPNAVDISITGALFINTNGMNVDPGYDGNITITTDPMKSAVITAYNPGPTFSRWSPAGDAFFKYIRRNPTP